MLTFLSELRLALTCSHPDGVLLDFSNTQKFVSSGTLLFFAELSRLIKMTSGRVRIRCKPPKNHKASQVLEQIGVYRLCNCSITVTPTHDDVVHWRVAHGHWVDNNLCAAAIEEFEGQLAPPLVDGIFRGLGEAQTNAKHHAYLKVRPDGLNYDPPSQDWWMFSQAKDNHLSVVFCDLGVGIPETLPLQRPNIVKRILTLGKADSDGAYIEEAIRDSKTRTQLPERGKGLGNIVNVVSNILGGVVIVYSNRGLYSLSNGKTDVRDFAGSIMGTMICWRIPLTGAAKDGE